MNTVVITAGLGLALVIGIIKGALPAAKVMHVSIIDTLQHKQL